MRTMMRTAVVSGVLALALTGCVPSEPSAADWRASTTQALEDTAREVYGTEPVIEPYTQWIGNQGVLAGLPIVGVGVSRADSGIDGPNENIRIDDYRDGIRHVIAVMAAMAAPSEQSEGKSA